MRARYWNYADVKRRAGDPFDPPFVFTVRYADLPSGESVAPYLYFWKTPSGGWEQIPANHNAANRTLTAVLDHLTEFAVMQEGMFRLYLPSAMR